MHPRISADNINVAKFVQFPISEIFYYYYLTLHLKNYSILKRILHISTLKPTSAQFLKILIKKSKRVKFTVNGIYKIKADES